MQHWTGILLAGLLNGSFAVPLKTARVWKFDHIWAVHSLLAMVFFPWATVIVGVPDWRAILSAVSGMGWLGLIGWGVLFGVASLLYGVAVDLLGIALGFSIQLGLSMVLGALLPLIWSRSLPVGTTRDRLFLFGLAVMVAGIVVCAKAGGAKSAGLKVGATGSTGAHFRKGLIIAIIGGVLAPTLNFGIRYGTSLLAAVGPTSTGQFPNQTYLLWAVFLTPAGVVQSGYCLARVLRENRAGAFRSPGAMRDAAQVFAMSTLWIASVFIYGRSAFGLGRLGYSFGWPVFIALIVLTSNAWGVVLGEWKGAAGSPFRKMLAGSALLIVATFLIGQGNPG